MDCKINWTDRAWQTFQENIDYLRDAWTQKEINQFILLVDKNIARLAMNPKIGSARNKHQPNIRATLIHKRVLLIYKHRVLKNEIDLLVFWNTAQHPRKLKIK